jgi:small subunit ribosomal protein S6
MFVVDAGLEENVVNETVEKIKNLISANGELKDATEWGKRKFAYPIKHKTDGFYYVFTFSAPREFPAELERIFRITDQVMRSLTLRKGK